MLNNKSILITGGTGSLGKALVKRILKDYPDVKRLVVFSRDEQKQFQMSQEFPDTKFQATITAATTTYCLLLTTYYLLLTT